MKTNLKRKQVRIYLNPGMEKLLSELMDKAGTLTESAVMTEILSRALIALSKENYPFGVNLNFRVVDFSRYQKSPQDLVESLHLPPVKNNNRLVHYADYLRGFGVPDSEIQCVLSDTAWESKQATH